MFSSSFFIFFILEMLPRTISVSCMHKHYRIYTVLLLAQMEIMVEGDQKSCAFAETVVSCIQAPKHGQASARHLASPSKGSRFTTRRKRDHSKLLHIFISLLNHKSGATSAAAHAACECLSLHPFLPLAVLCLQKIPGGLLLAGRAQKFHRHQNVGSDTTNQNIQEGRQGEQILKK